MIKVLTFLLVSYIGFAQTVVSKDSVDVFEQGADESILKQSKQLIDNEIHNGFWKEFSDKFKDDFDAPKQYGKLLSVNVDTWEMSLFDARRKQSKFLKEHADFTKFKPEFKQFIENQIRWNYWHYLVAYPIVRGNADTKSLKVTSLPDILLEGLEPTKISNEDALLCQPYRDFLPYFVTYFNSKANNFDKYKDLGKAMDDKVAFARMHLSGQVQAYYLARLLHENCQQTPPSSVKVAFAHLSKIPNTAQYVALVQSRCQEVLNKKDEAKKPIAEKAPEPKKDEYEFMNLEGKPFYFSDFKGKVLYVDFWASWCGPCRMEFPNSKALHEKLTEKQKKKVAFLYLSLDESEEAWKAALEKLQLKGENGHIKNAFGAKIARDFNISSIPRYVLIDKNGKIANENAPRPSSSDIQEILLKLIND